MWRPVSYGIRKLSEGSTERPEQLRFPSRGKKWFLDGRLSGLLIRLSGGHELGLGFVKEHSENVTPPASSVGREVESATTTARSLDFIKDEVLDCQIDLEELKEKVVRMGSRCSR